VDDKFFQQQDGMAKESSLSPIVSTIFMEHSETPGLGSALNKSSLWLRYFDDKFVVWLHGPEQLQNFLSHFNYLRPSIRFTIEIESDSAIPFLDVLVIRKETTLTTKVYRIQSLHNRTSPTSQERKDLVNEISNPRCDLQLNSYPQGCIDSAINSKGSSRPNKEANSLAAV
jgi:hypothetical protein